MWPKNNADVQEKKIRTGKRLYTDLCVFINVMSSYLQCLWSSFLVLYIFIVNWNEIIFMNHWWGGIYVIALCLFIFLFILYSKYCSFSNSPPKPCLPTAHPPLIPPKHKAFQGNSTEPGTLSWDRHPNLWDNLQKLDLAPQINPGPPVMNPWNRPSYTTVSRMQMA